MAVQSTYYYAAQFLGFFAGGMWIWSVSLKSDKRLNQVWILNNLLFVCHYAMLGAWVGALVHFINAMRSGVYVIRDWRLTPYKWPVLAGFLAVFTAVTLYKYQDWTDWFPLYGAYATCLAFFLFCGVPARMILISGNMAWLFYAAAHHSYGGVMSLVAIIVITCRTITQLRHDQKGAALPAMEGDDV